MDKTSKVSFSGLFVINTLDLNSLCKYCQITGPTETSRDRMLQPRALECHFSFSLHIISKEFICLTVVSHFCIHRFLSIFFSQINFTKILHRLTGWANCNLLFKWRKCITYSAVFFYRYFIEGTNSVVTTPPSEGNSAIMKKLYPWLVKLKRCNYWQLETKSPYSKFTI